MLNQGALVLNASFEPLLVVDWKKAVTLLYLRKVEVLEEYPVEIRSVSARLSLPAVIRLTRLVKRRARLRIPLTRRNVFLRDNFTCQYDGKIYAVAHLTVDHVVPRSRGGKTSWDNLVTSCARCNRSKGNATPEAAGLTLSRMPRAPSPSRILSIKMGLDRVPGLWQPYLSGWLKESA